MEQLDEFDGIILEWNANTEIENGTAPKVSWI